MKEQKRKKRVAAEETIKIRRREYVHINPYERVDEHGNPEVVSGHQRGVEKVEEQKTGGIFRRKRRDPEIEQAETFKETIKPEEVE